MCFENMDTIDIVTSTDPIGATGREKSLSFSGFPTHSSKSKDYTSLLNSIVVLAASAELLIH